MSSTMSMLEVASEGRRHRSRADRVQISKIDLLPIACEVRQSMQGSTFDQASHRREVKQKYAASHKGVQPSSEEADHASVESHDRYLSSKGFRLEGVVDALNRKLDYVLSKLGEVTEKMEELESRQNATKVHVETLDESVAAKIEALDDSVSERIEAHQETVSAKIEVIEDTQESLQEDCELLKAVLLDPEIGLVLVIERAMSTEGQEAIYRALREVPAYTDAFVKNYSYFKREFLSGSLRTLAKIHGAENDRLRRDNLPCRKHTGAITYPTTEKGQNLQRIVPKFLVHYVEQLDVVDTYLGVRRGSAISYKGVADPGLALQNHPMDYADAKRKGWMNMDGMANFLYDTAWDADASEVAQASFKALDVMTPAFLIVNNVDSLHAATGLTERDNQTRNMAAHPPVAGEKVQERWSKIKETALKTEGKLPSHVVQFDELNKIVVGSSNVMADRMDQACDMLDVADMTSRPAGTVPSMQTLQGPGQNPPSATPATNTPSNRPGQQEPTSTPGPAPTSLLPPTSGATLRPAPAHMTRPGSHRDQAGRQPHGHRSQTAHIPDPSLPSGSRHQAGMGSQAGENPDRASSPAESSAVSRATRSGSDALAAPFFKRTIASIGILKKGQAQGNNVGNRGDGTQGGKK